MILRLGAAGTAAAASGAGDSVGAAAETGVGAAAAVVFVFEFAALFALSPAGFFGAKKYCQPKRMNTQRTAAIKKRFWLSVLLLFSIYRSDGVVTAFCEGLAP